MAKKFNIMIVSNSIEYADQLKRSSMFSDIINIEYVVKSVTELKNKLHIPIDMYLISDNLANEETLEDVIGILQETDSFVYGVLVDENQGDILQNYGVDYCLEKDYAAMSLIEFLEESLKGLGEDFQGEQSQPVEIQEPEDIKEVPSPKDDFIEPKVERTVESLPTTYKDNVHPVSKQKPAEKYESRPKGRTTLGLIKNKIVSFTSSKGGVGKSSLAIETASCIAQRANQVALNQSTTRGQSDKVNVVLVDLNFAFGTIPSTLDCILNAEKQVTLLDWVVAIENKILSTLSNDEKRELQGQTYPDFVPYLKRLNRNQLIFSKQEILSLLVFDETTGLYILPTVSSPFDVDSVRKEYISIIVEELSRIFDIIIIDTGNNLSHFTSEAYYLSDEIYVVGQPVIHVGVILKQLINASVKVLGVDKDKFRLVINHPNQSARGADAQGMAQSLDIPLVADIPYDENVGLAHEAGHYYAINNRKRRFSNEVALLANQICPLWNVVDRNKKSYKRKLFGK